MFDDDQDYVDVPQWAEDHDNSQWGAAPMATVPLERMVLRRPYRKPHHTEDSTMQTEQAVMMAAICFLAAVVEMTEPSNI